LHVFFAMAFVATVILSLFITPASANFVHTRGIMIVTYPQDILVFWNYPNSYDRTFAVVIKPPWYFVPGLMGFTSVTLTITLSYDCYQCKPSAVNPPVLAGADNNGRLVVNLGAVEMTEDDNGALLLVPFTIIVPGVSDRGFYMFYLSAEADAADGTIFTGWDQIPLAIMN